MRKRLCNSCKTYSPVSEWDWGCPNCGYSNQTGEIVRISEYPGVQVMPDIKPYVSMADGSLVEGRAQHREMLKRTGSREIGNEVKYLTTPTSIPDAAPQQRKESIIAQIQALGGHENFKRALKKDIDNIKWNSRTK